MKKTPEDIQSSRRGRKVSDNALLPADLKKRCRLFGLRGEFGATDAFFDSTHFDMPLQACTDVGAHLRDGERRMICVTTAKKNSARESCPTK
ncbi:MAG TPA: hypothetical protein PKH33_10650 [bacterium]|nr:hypothetical protein [bacterium]